MAYQHAIISYPNLREIPPFQISYTNKYRPAFVINYALKFGENYFAYCFFYFFKQ